MGYARCARALIPDMRERGDGDASSTTSSAAAGISYAPNMSRAGSRNASALLFTRRWPMKLRPTTCW